MSAKQWSWTPGGMVFKGLVPGDNTYNRFVDSKDYAVLEQQNAELRAKLEAFKSFEQIQIEVERAMRKFPDWPTDPLHALAVLGEEYGELTKALLQYTYEPHKTSSEEVRIEAIQTAAMALRFVMSLEKYSFKQSYQHQQLLPEAGE